MITYRIVLKWSVQKDIRRFPASILGRLREAMEALRSNPYPPGCEKIRGEEDHYRIRIGDYRIVYHVGTTIRIITIVKIGHRKDVYQAL